MKKYFTILFILILPALVFCHGVSPNDQKILDNGDLLSYIYVGAKHMLTGYDHLLFLVGVIFYLSSFKDILKFISVFTFGHCITLIYATYSGLTINEHAIDAIIALSVVYKGLENLGWLQKITNRQPPNLLTMVLIFGLIHGLGLSARLQSFNMGYDNFLVKILSFNLGVELGQVLALFPMVLIYNQLIHTNIKTKISNWVNGALVIIGFFLFGLQLFYFTSDYISQNMSLSWIFLMQDLQSS